MDEKGWKKLIRKGVDVEFRCPKCGHKEIKKVKAENPFLWMLGFQLVIPMFIMAARAFKESRAQALMAVASGKMTAEEMVKWHEDAIGKTTDNARAAGRARAARNGGSASIDATGALSIAMADKQAKKMKKVLICPECHDACYKVKVLGWHDKNRCK